MPCEVHQALSLAVPVDLRSVMFYENDQLGAGKKVSLF